MVWIIGGNIWDSISRYQIQLLLQQCECECMLKYVNSRGGRKTERISSPLTPHPGGWRECSAELAELAST